MGDRVAVTQFPAMNDDPWPAHKKDLLDDVEAVVKKALQAVRKEIVLDLKAELASATAASPPHRKEVKFGNTRSSAQVGFADSPTVKSMKSAAPKEIDWRRRHIRSYQKPEYNFSMEEDDGDFFPFSMPIASVSNGRKSVRVAASGLRKSVVGGIRKSVMNMVPTALRRGASPDEDDESDGPREWKDSPRPSDCGDSDIGGESRDLVALNEVQHVSEDIPTANDAPNGKEHKQFRISDGLTPHLTLEGTLESLPEPLSDVEVERSQTSTKHCKALTNSSEKIRDKISTVESAWGFAAAESMSQEHHWRQPTKRQLLAKLVRSHFFECCTMLLVFGNAIVVGMQVDFTAQHLDEKMPMHFRIVDLVFCVLFTLELLLRLVAHGTSFFTTFGWAWNWFDLVLVVIQLVEETLLAMAITERDDLGGSKDNAPEAGGEVLSSSLMRVIRLLRAVRVIRVLRVLRVAEDLQLLMSCILHSFKSFFWALMLIMMMVYVIAIYLTQIVASHRIEAPRGTDRDAKLAAIYGNVPKACVALFQSLTGGVDWNDTVSPLWDTVGVPIGSLAMLFIAFAILAVLNIVNGIFVAGSISRADEVKRLQMLAQARKLFKMLDQDGSGQISFDEIQDHLDAPAVHEYFKSLDVDVSEAVCLFQVLDMDNSGQIDFGEFMASCIRLQGPARAVDLMLLMRETRSHFDDVLRCLLHMEESLGVLQQSSSGGRPSELRKAAGQEDAPGAPEGTRGSRGPSSRSLLQVS
eukprot:TRINITY_DN100810_c0_g1_i1.p1 TRINITY_DN100810_c0_g1~~TRINITY_DN100810_c0_g1_i1.p1  ORF type:complete len:750 (-),score=171.96 TRINITY_DN100810_c0_g1_i1:106-2355(-)